MKVDLNELDISYIRSSGPGGQNVNKVNSKCVLKWNPECSQCLSQCVKSRFIEKFRNRISVNGFIVITSDRYRDQKRNFEDCLQKLENMISVVATLPKIRKKTTATRSSQKKRVEKKRVHSDKKKLRQSSKNWNE